MPPLEQEYGTARNRLLKALTGGPEPGDVGSALLRSLGSRGTTYGEQIEGLQAGRAGKAKAVLDIFAGERAASLEAEKHQIAREQLNLAGRRVDLEDQKFQFQKVQSAIAAARDRKDKDAERLFGAMEFFLEDLSPDQRAAVGNQMAARVKELQPESALGVYSAVASVANKAGLKKPVKLATRVIERGDQKITQIINSEDGSVIDEEYAVAPRFKDAPTGSMVIPTPWGDITYTGSAAGKRAGEAQEALEAARVKVDDLEKLMVDVKERPSSVGISGTLIDTIGGLVTQIPVLGRLAESQLHTQEVQQLRTRMIRLLGSHIDSIIEDDRYSDAERAIAQDALAATDPTSSIYQIEGAFESLLQIERAQMARSKMKIANIPDLTTSDGISEYMLLLQQEHPDWENDQIVNKVVEDMTYFGVPK